MNFKHLLIAFSFVSACFQALNAVNVECTPGALKSLVDPQATSLTITGSLDASDFHFIQSEMPNLVSLDLADATIAAYKGAPVLLNRDRANAGVLPEFALAGLKISSLVLPASLSEIGDGALSGSAITTVAIPASVTTIGTGAFAGCPALRSVTIPASVTTVGTDIFSRCSALESVVWNANTIPASTFAGCSAITSVEAPAITAIGDKAFIGCSALRTFTFPASVASIGNSAFEGAGINNADLSHASSLSTIGDWAFAKCPNLASATLPVTATTLGKGAFFECPSLLTVNVPDALTKIPDYAFKGDSALSVDMLRDSKVVVVGNYALAGLDEISTFWFPATLRRLGDEAMSGWTSLNMLHADNLYVIPEVGSDVWAGIDQSTVKLVVPDDVYNQFKAASQWCDFDVVDVTSSTAIEIDRVSANRIKAWFEGSQLFINTTGGEIINNVVLYNIAGNMCLQAAPKASSVIIDTNEIANHIYLVGVRLADGSAHTVKIAR